MAAWRALQHTAHVQLINANQNRADWTLRLQRSLTNGCTRFHQQHSGATYANMAARFSLVGREEVTDALVAPMAAVQLGGQSVDLGEIIDGAQLQL